MQDDSDDDEDGACNSFKGNLFNYNSCRWLRFPCLTSLFRTLLSLLLVPCLALPCPFFCRCLSLRALPLSLRNSSLSSPFSSLLFLFCFFVAFQARQTVAISFHFVALPAARSLLTNCCCMPHVFGLCFGAPSSSAATLQVSLLETRLESSLWREHLPARNAQLISACAAPPSNCK